MAEEAKPGFADAFVESLAEGIQGFLEPKEEGFFHNWLSLSVWVDFVGEWCISRGAFLFALYIPLLVAASALLPQFFQLTFGWILLAFPVLAVTVGIVGFWGAWIWYVQSLFTYKKTEPILLEVKMPEEITKSPRAMEQVFANLWIRYSETTFIDRSWYGGKRPYFSFELVSLGGEVHFYIWTKGIFRTTIEMNMYAQYPEVEIVEAEDYSKKFIYDDSVECFVTEYPLTSNIADPAEPDHEKYAAINAYPPKSYIDFELDKDPKDEFRVDPFASVIEVLSACNKEEQMWIQIVIRSHLDEYWKDAVEDEVEKIRIASTKLKEVDEDDDSAGFPRPTWKQNEQIRTMERHLSKLPFEVGVRGIYAAPANKMRSPEYTAMRWIWRPFANPNWMSQFRPRRGHNIFDYAWQDWNGIRYRLFSRRFLDAYRRRCFFGYPWKTPYNIVSTETLATMWHPPSNSVKAPGLARIPVAKSEAPANLPM